MCNKSFDSFQAVLSVLPKANVMPGSRKSVFPSWVENSCSHLREKFLSSQPLLAPISKCLRGTRLWKGKTWYSMISTSGPHLGPHSNLAGGTGCLLLSSTSASLETLCDAATRWVWVHLVNGNRKEEASLHCKDLGQTYQRAWMLREEILYFSYFQAKNHSAASGSVFYQESHILTSLIASAKARQRGNAASRKNLSQYLFSCCFLLAFPLNSFP